MPRLTNSYIKQKLEASSPKMSCINHESIHVEFKRSAEFLMSGLRLDRIIKMDAHNEVVGKPMVPHQVALVEIDENTVNRAAKLGLNVISGSILNLPVRSGSMDLVVDCSTIDHVGPKFVNQALSEYHRVLAPRGRLLMLVWCTGSPELLKKSVAEGEKQHGPNHQFYFDDGAVMLGLLKAGFEPIVTTKFAIEPFMLRYVCEK